MKQISSTNLSIFIEKGVFRRTVSMQIETETSSKQLVKMVALRAILSNFFLILKLNPTLVGRLGLGVVMELIF